MFLHHILPTGRLRTFANHVKHFKYVPEDLRGGSATQALSAFSGVLIGG